MILYLGTFLFLAILTYLSVYAKSINTNKIVQIILFTILFVIAGFKNEGVSVDDLSYKYSFYLFGSPEEFFTNFLTWAFYEPMYYLIPSLYKTYLFPNEFTLATFVTYAAISIYFKFRSINYLSEFFIASLLAYFSFLYFLHEFTQIRAGLVSSIMLYSVKYLYEKKKIKFIIAIAIATLFHYSSLLFLPLLFLDTKKSKKKIYSVLIVLSLIFSLIDTYFLIRLLPFDISFITLKADNYINLNNAGKDEVINKFNTNYLLVIFTSIVYVYFWEKIEAQNKYSIILIKMQIISIFLFQVFSSIPAFAFRSSELYLVSTIITYPFIIYLFKNRTVGFIVFIMLCSIQFYINLFRHELVQPYQFIFFNQ